MSASDGDPAARSRLLPLAGGRNFRDLGGYPAADGRRVRWRHLYRSGVMSYLTDADCLHLDALGIRVICDFRTQKERSREVTRWGATPPRQLSWHYDNTHFSIRGMLGSGEITAPNAHQGMMRLYGILPTALAEPYAVLFAQLAGGEVPLVFNCSAGKDRTGVAAALVLSALGVPWEHVLADYRLTNELVDLEKVYAARHEGSIGIGDDINGFLKLDPQVRAPLLRAEPEYLETAFATIRQDHGSVEGYLREVLDVGAAQLEDIRARLLESPG